MFGSIFLVRLGDQIGRKPVILASTFISNIALLCCQFLAQTHIYLLIYIFIFGLTILPSSLLSYVLVCELTPKEHQTFYMTLAMLFDSLGMIFLGIYFDFLSKSMKPLIVGLIILQFVLIAIMWAYVPESPKFFYEKGQTEKFIQTLRWIAKVNGRDSEMVISMEELKNLEKKDEE
jgi:MFS family permease